MAAFKQNLARCMTAVNEQIEPTTCDSQSSKALRSSAMLQRSLAVLIAPLALFAPALFAVPPARAQTALDASPERASASATNVSVTNASDTLRRPVATYSIVARDPETGQMGVAVQSHFFSVGSVVPWAEAGVGAVATQAFAEPKYGPLGLDLMRAGRSAPEALEALVSTDDGRAVRQVAMVDAEGRAAAHTGARAIEAAGHHTGAHYSAQANLMERPTVWDAMAEAYENAEGDLAARLLTALEAAQGEGGDIRGRQSAAILVVSGERQPEPWQGRLFDLRVEDDPHPVQELKRLVRLQRAYRQISKGDAAVTDGDIEGALDAYQRAMNLVPDAATEGETPFWVGVTLADVGRPEEALPYLRRAYAQRERWAELIPRLPAAGLLPDDDALIERLVREMKTPPPDEAPDPQP